MNVSLSFLMMSKSMSASAGPTTPGAHLMPMLMSPADAVMGGTPQCYCSSAHALQPTSETQSKPVRIWSLDKSPAERLSSHLDQPLRSQQ